MGKGGLGEPGVDVDVGVPGRGSWLFEEVFEGGEVGLGGAVGSAFGAWVWGFWGWEDVGVLKGLACGMLCVPSWGSAFPAAASVKAWSSFLGEMGWAVPRCW